MTVAQMVKQMRACRTEEDADRVVGFHVDAMQAANTPWTRQRCDQAVRTNIGHVAGYLGQTEAIRLTDLFKTRHPIVRRAAAKPEEALARGRRLLNDSLAARREGRR